LDRFCSPPSGAFDIAPSIDTQLQSSPTNSSYPSSASVQNCSKTPAFVHSKNLRCADELEQIPVPFSAFHWQPVRSTNRIAFIAARFETRGLWHPKGCFLPGGKSGSIFAQSASGIRHPSSRATKPMPAVFTDRFADGNDLHAICML
jgi:hypothetical protein